VLFWILYALLFLMTFLLCLQPMYEAINKPGVMNGEKYLTVVDPQGYSLSIRVYCTGPFYDNDTLKITSPAILLEVGGGSSAVDLIGLQ